MPFLYTPAYRNVRAGRSAFTIYASKFRLGSSWC